MAIDEGSRFGEWELIDRIGEGGNGAVWRARHRDGHLGAIKFLHRKFIEDGSRYRRFFG